VPVGSRPQRKAARGGGGGGGAAEDDSGVPLSVLPQRNAAGCRGKGGRTRKGSLALGSEPQASTHPDSDDDNDTMCPPNLKLNKDQKDVVIPKNIWSYDFAAACGHLDYYAKNRGSNMPSRQVWLMKERDTAVLALVGSHLEATITRRASPYLMKLLELKGFDLSSSDLKITFTVRCNSGRNFYLMYDDYAGVVTVIVEKIMSPKADKTGNVDEDEKWKETCEYRRVFDTKDACIKSKGRPSSGEYMGEAYFRKLLEEEQQNGTETFHSGDCIYKGDIRKLVGVVRWKKINLTEIPRDYFHEYAEADLFDRGEAVNQNRRQ
jgi:hypothetical protein